jgi:hypothetical protein
MQLQQSTQSLSSYCLFSFIPTEYPFMYKMILLAAIQI